MKDWSAENGQQGPTRRMADEILEFLDFIDDLYAMLKMLLGWLFANIGEVTGEVTIDGHD